MDFDNGRCLLDAIGDQGLDDFLDLPEDFQATVNETSQPLDASSLESALDLPNSLDTSSLDLPTTTNNNALWYLQNSGQSSTAPTPTNTLLAQSATQNITQNITQNVITPQNNASVVVTPNAATQQLVPITTINSSNFNPAIQLQTMALNNKTTAIQPQLIQQTVQQLEPQQGQLQLPTGFVLQTSQGAPANNLSTALQTSTGQIQIQQPTIGQAMNPAVNDGTNSNLAGVVNIQSAGVVNLSVNQVPQITGQSVQLRPATSIQQTIQPALQSSTGGLNLQGTLIQTAQGNKILIQHPVGQQFSNVQPVRLPATTANKPIAPVINVRQQQPQYIVQKGAGPGGQNIILQTIPAQGQTTAQQPQQIYVTQPSQVTRPQGVQNVNIQQIIKPQLTASTGAPPQFSIQQAVQPNAAPSTAAQHILVQGPSGLIQVPIQHGQIQGSPQTKIIQAPQASALPAALQTTLQHTSGMQPTLQATSGLQPTIQAASPMNIAQLASQSGLPQQDISAQLFTQPQPSATPDSTSQLIGNAGDNYIQVSNDVDGYTSQVITPTQSRATTPARTLSRSSTPARTPTPSHTPTPAPIQLFSSTPSQVIPQNALGQVITQQVSANQGLHSLLTTPTQQVTTHQGVQSIQATPAQQIVSNQGLPSLQATPTVSVNSTPTAMPSQLQRLISAKASSSVNILPTSSGCETLGYTAQGAATVGNTITAPPNANAQNLPQHTIPTVPSTASAAQPTNATNKPQTIQLSAANQKTLQTIQQQIKNLLLVTNPSETQQKTLQNLAEVQQKILVQGRVQALQSQLNPTKPTGLLTGSQSVLHRTTVKPMGVTLNGTGALNQTSLPQVGSTPKPPLHVVTVANNVQATPPHYVSTEQTTSQPVLGTSQSIPATPQPALGGTIHSTTPGIPQSSTLQTCTRTPTAVISSAGKITVTSPSVVDPEKLIQVLPPQIREKLQTQLSNMTPEQRQNFLQTQPIFVKLQQIVQRQQQQKAAQLASQNMVTVPSTASVQGSQSGSIPATVATKVAVSGSKVVQLNTTTNTTTQIEQRGVKRPAETDSSNTFVSKIHQRLATDQRNVTEPDYQTGFVSPQDAMNRLMSFHVYQSPDPDPVQEEKDEEAFEDCSSNLLGKMDDMLCKYRYLLFNEAIKPSCSSELVMIERMFIHQEKLQLVADKKLAMENPAAFEPLPYIEPEIPKEVIHSSEVKQEVIDVKQEPAEIKNELDPYAEVKKEGDSSDKYTVQTQGALKFVIKNKPKVEIKSEPMDIKPRVGRKVSPQVINLDDSDDDCEPPPLLEQSSSMSVTPGGTSCVADEASNAVHGLLDNEPSYSAEQSSEFCEQYEPTKCEPPFYSDGENPSIQQSSNSNETENAINSILTFEGSNSNVMDSSMDPYMSGVSDGMDDDINAAVQSIL